MLDQNTDRMWFVIGAVIVGAAIIFIANGTLPTLFASVSDSFEESASKGTNVIDDIKTYSDVTEFVGDSSQEGVPTFDTPVNIDGVDTIQVGFENIVLPEPLRAVHEYKDRLYLDTDGIWKISRNIGVTTLTGSAEFNVRMRSDITMEPSFMPFDITNAMPDGYAMNDIGILTDRFDIAEVSEDGEAFNPEDSEYIRNSNVHYATFIIIGIRRDRLGSETVDGIRQWLNDNPIVIQYVKNESIEVLSNGLQKQLNNALNIN